jgi:hypothetical protein
MQVEQMMFSLLLLLHPLPLLRHRRRRRHRARLCSNDESSSVSGDVFY